MADSDCLTELEEKLLLKWLDGECNWFEGFRVRRLLSRCEAARAFVDQMEAVEQSARRWGSERCALNVDLWDRIVHRLDEEERAEVLIGRRVIAHSVPGERFRSIATWGLSGACAAAVVAGLLVVSEPGSVGKLGGDEGEVTLNGGEVAVAALPVSTGANGRYGVEMDWMRSQGRVRLIQDPSSTSAIIWVNRQRSGPYYVSGPADLIARATLTPLP